MTKYQIRFCDSKGHGYFRYVDVKSKKEAGQKAAKVATDDINERKSRYSAWIPFSQPEKPKRIVHVWEMDMEKKQPKKGGHRFKLELYFTEITYGSGRKVRNEWYQPVPEPKNSGK